MLYSLFPSGGRAVLDAAIMFYAAPEKHPTRLLDFHDLFFQLDGSWNVFLEDEEICLTPGDIAFLPAGYHHYGAQKCVPNTRTMYIHFEALSGDRIIKRKAKNIKRLSSGIELESWTRNANPRVIDFFETVLKIQKSEQPFKKLYCSSILNMLLIELSASHRQMAARRDQLVHKVADFLNHNTNRFFTIKELAVKYGISPRGLTARFKSEMGQSIHRYQMNSKLNQIAEVLQSNSYNSLKNLACNFGFYNEFHLSRSFKQKFGVSPKNYTS